MGEPGRTSVQPTRVVGNVCTIIRVNMVTAVEIQAI